MKKWTAVLALLSSALIAFAAVGTPASCVPGALACAGADTPLWLIILFVVLVLAGIGIVIYALVGRRERQSQGRRSSE